MDEPGAEPPHLLLDGRFLIGVTLGLLTALAAFSFGSGPDEPDVAHYRTVRDFVRDSFVRDVTNEELLDHALHGMLAGLDPYSRYYDSDESKALERETVGRYTGIGVVFQNPVTEGVVLFTLADSPGRRAGLRAGDRIRSIDGEACSEMDDAQFRSTLSRPPSAVLRLAVEGRDGGLREVSLSPESLIDPTVRHPRILDEERGIGYVAVLSFSHETPSEFDEAFEYLLSRGMQALILDLRANYGGVLESAVRVARRFIREGTIVSTEGRGERVVSRAEPGAARHAGFPLVVLVDGGSASASEVLAGALQDHRAAVITGSPTYGKGMVQTIRRFDDTSSRAKVTSSYYYSPTHRNFERSAQDGGEPGIQPDLEIDIDDRERSRVHAYLDRYSPPIDQLADIEAWEAELGSTVFDHPQADAQLTAALELLQGRRPGAYAVIRSADERR